MTTLSLTRRTDRVELSLRLTAVALALLLLPFALAAGSETYVSRSTLADAQARALHPVTATVLEQPAGAPTTTRLARWPLPDGTSRIGRVQMDQGSTQPGDQVHIWLDTTGNAANPPVTEAGAVVVGIGVALLGWALCVLVLAGLFGLARLALHRRRAAALQREWEQVEPLWSRELA